MTEKCATIVISYITQITIQFKSARYEVETGIVRLILVSCKSVFDILTTILTKKIEMAH